MSHCTSLLLCSVALAVAGTPLAARAEGARVTFVFKGSAGFSPEVLAEVKAVAAELVAEAGDLPEDATPVYAALYARGAQPDFAEGPPAGWPQALAADWRAGNAACLRHVAAQRSPVESDCAPLLAGALWNRWLALQGPARVVEVSLVEAEAPASGVTVSAVAFRPGDPQGHRVRAGASSPGDAPRVARHALGLLLQGLGDRVATALPAELPRAPAPGAAPQKPAPGAKAVAASKKK
jgi:hypothetical protein